MYIHVRIKAQFNRDLPGGGGYARLEHGHRAARTIMEFQGVGGTRCKQGIVPMGTGPSDTDLEGDQRCCKL